MAQGENHEAASSAGLPRMSWMLTRVSSGLVSALARVVGGLAH